MTTTIKATYVQGVFKPQEPIALAEGAQVELTLTMPVEEGDPLDEVIGICTEGPDLSLAARHDELLYGLRPPVKEQP